MENKRNMKKTKTAEPMFRPPYSTMTRTHLTNNLMGVRIMAGAMEKLRYKISMRRATTKSKVPFRILSSKQYNPRKVEDYVFRTGSKLNKGYIGPLGMDGFCEYRYHDGAVYHGNVWCNKFAGEGTVKFPNGSELRAFWVEGVAFNPEYTFSDGLQYKHQDWEYCTMPDRRFFSEHKKGINPSGNVQLSNDHPAPALPVGSYDSGEGYFNPYSKEMINPITGEFMRIPSQSERRWILNHCRREWITPLPFDPTLYENWFPKYNEQIRVKSKSIWEGAHKCIGEMSGLEKKIETLTGFKPHLINTSKDKLDEIHNLLNRRYENLNKHNFVSTEFSNT